MPYVVRKHGNQWIVVNKNTGKKLPGTSSSKQKAQSRANVVNAKEYGDWKPTGAKARYKKK